MAETPPVDNERLNRTVMKGARSSITALRVVVGNGSRAQLLTGRDSALIAVTTSSTVISSKHEKLDAKSCTVSRLVTAHFHINIADELVN